MKKVNQIYKCNICGNIVEMVHIGKGELVCCGQPMELLLEKSIDDGLEKHKPIIDKQLVKVGSVPHPMDPDHHIEWIEIIDEDNVCRKNLLAGDKPEAEFCDKNITVARAFCNVHGLWKN